MRTLLDSARRAAAAALFALVLLTWAGPARAGCYQDRRVRSIAEAAPPVVRREVLILIDQTVAYPDPVRQQVLAQLPGIVTGGTIVSVGSFSSYSGQTLPRLLATQFIEPPIPQALERRVSMRGRRILAGCIAESQASGLRAGERLLQVLFRASRPTISQSDIMSSLSQFGSHLRASRAPHRIVILVSDMLENSSTTSFYAHRRVRQIDPEVELHKAAAAHLFADLAGARVFVIGAGLPPPDFPGTVPDALTRSLEAFWSAYFANSHATLAGFGRPTLFEPIR